MIFGIVTFVVVGTLRMKVSKEKREWPISLKGGNAGNDAHER